MKAKISVEALTKKQLQKALDENLFWGEGKLSPISKNKVIWLLKSPRIDDDDYCLFLGLADDEIVAFIHTIPDLIDDKNGGLKKVYWMIEWWVSSSYKDTILGIYLFNETIAKTQQNVLIKAYAENVNEFYAQQPFTALSSRKRYTIFFGLNADSIVGKFKFMRHFRFFLNISNAISYWVVARLNTRIIGKSTASLSYEYLKELDTETWSFIKKQTTEDVIHKSKDYVNWQIDPNQYLQIPIGANYKQKSQIRGYASSINLHNIKVVKDAKVIGFISVLDFNGEGYLKYFIAEESNLKIVVSVLIEHLIKLNISHIFTENNLVVDTINNHFKKVYLYAVTKTSIAYTKLYDDLLHTNITEQDGHFL